MNNILLRFRDTENIDTIASHNDIIEEYGFTWWGWWKKDSEPYRQTLLMEIKEKIRYYSFYLFDRSAEKFFKAEISDIYFDADNKINTPEYSKTPDYYNSKKLFAWFKITKIVTISELRFKEVFNLVPSEDFTFFTHSDLEVEIINNKNSRRISVVSNYILHLSDIHFGDDFGFPSQNSPGKTTLIDKIKDYVIHNFKKKIGLLIVSGDISSRGNSDILLGVGLTFLNELCDFLGLNKECVIIIPGNHDIPLKDADFQSYNHENMFKLFLKEFYCINKEPFGIDLFLFPGKRKVDILRINSVKLRNKEQSNYGYVEWSHYKNLLSSVELDGDLKIAVMHHHLVSTQSEETIDSSYPFANISVTLDSGKVIDGLQQNNFDIVLNGHQHVPGITKISRGKIDNSNVINMNNSKELTILSAGSAGAKDSRFSTEMKYNSFSIYNWEDNVLHVEVLQYNSSIEPKRFYISNINLR